MITRKQAWEDALREVLQTQHGANGFTTTDGKRVEFRLRVDVHDGVSDARLNAFLVANGQRAYGRAVEWAKWLLEDGRAIPEGFYDHFKVVWAMKVQ